MVRIGLLLVCLLAAMAATAQVVEVIETVTPVKVAGDVAIVEFGPLHTASRMHTGPFDGIPAAIEQFRAEIKKQGIKAAGDIMIIYHSDPQTVPPEKLQWELAVPIAAEAKPVEPLKARDLEKCTVAKARYEGPADEMTPFYYGLAKEAFGKGYVPVGPAIETPDAEEKEGVYSSTVMFVVRKAPKLEVTFEPYGPQPIVYVEHTGPYDQIPKAIGAFFAEAGKQQVKIGDALVGIYHNDPASTPPDELKWDIAVPVGEAVKVAEPLKTRELPECTMARAKYSGSADGLADAYTALYMQVGQEGYVPAGSPMELFGQPPKDGQYSCTIMWPVRKPPQLEVLYKDYEAHTIVFIEFTGSYDRIPKAIDEFIAEIEKQKVAGTGPLLGIYHSDPGTTPADELKWDVAVAVAEGTKVAEPLKTRQMPKGTVAEAKFSGNVDLLADAYTALFIQAGREGYVPAGPPMEQFGEEPKDGRYECTIMLPVRLLTKPDEPDQVQSS